MGALWTVTCGSCGYGEGVLEGYGFASVGYLPMNCADCRRSVSVAGAVADGDMARSMLGEELPAIGRCSECGGDRLTPIPLEGEPVGQGAGPDPIRRAGPCPRCAEPMTIESTGIWD